MEKENKNEMKMGIAIDVYLCNGLRKLHLMLLSKRIRLTLEMLFSVAKCIPQPVGSRCFVLQLYRVLAGHT